MRRETQAERALRHLREATRATAEGRAAIAEHAQAHLDDQAEDEATPEAGEDEAAP